MFYDKIRLSYTSSGISLPQTYVFDLGNPTPEDKYYIKEASGLGTVDFNLVTAPLWPMNDILGSRRPQSSEIILRIGLNPDYAAGETFQTLRDEFFFLAAGSGASPGSLLLAVGSGTTQFLPTAQKVVYLKRIETAGLSSDMDLIITLAAVTPYWESVSVTQLSEADRVLAPYGGNSTSSFDLWPVYEGSVETGFYIKIQINKVWRRLSMSNEDGSPRGLSFDWTTNFGQPGDVVSIETTPKARTAWMRRPNDPAWYNMMGYITAGSEWPLLTPPKIRLNIGISQIGAGTTNPPVPVIQEFSYKRKWWGV